MKMSHAVIALALLAGPAYAQQMPDVNLLPQEKTKTPEEIARDKAIQRAYRDSLRKIPDAKAANDPWGGMRSAGPSADSAPRHKPKTRARQSAR